MANIKISAAADAGTLLSSDMLPLARSGDSNAYHATMAEVATYTGASVASGAYGNVGRNLMHNSMFAIAQRGAGPFTAVGYTLDRWQMWLSGGSMSVSQVTLADADRAAIGDEAAEYAIQAVVTGGGGAGAFAQFIHYMEDVRRLGGKTITISFWAKAASGTPKIGVAPYQSFGTGGSPSASVLPNGTAVTIATTWARYSVTKAMPSISGKVVGTNGDSATPFQLYFSSGSTNNANAGGIGVQSGTFQIWGVQCEIGTVVTPLERLDPALQFQECQRFFTEVQVYWSGYATAAGQVFTASMPAQFMRTALLASPTAVLTVTNNASTNLGAPTLSYSGATFAAAATSAAAGAVTLNVVFTASADL